MVLYSSSQIPLSFVLRHFWLLCGARLCVRLPGESGNRSCAREPTQNKNEAACSSTPCRFKVGTEISRCLFFSLSFSSFENFPPILVASFFLLVSSSLELVLFSHLYLFAFFFLFLLRPSLSLSVGRVYFIVLALQGGGRLSLRERKKKRKTPHWVWSNCASLECEIRFRWVSSARVSRLLFSRAYAGLKKCARRKE